jgi:Family of unknown function (DUF5985)
MRAELVVALLNGATAMACLGVALFFARFWGESADRLFFCLSAAFVAFAANYATLGLLSVSDERRGYAFIIRLLAFLVILVGLVLKDRERAEHFMSGTRDGP